MSNNTTHYKLIVLGGSSGSTEIIPSILHGLDGGLKTPMIVVRHLSADFGDTCYNEVLGQGCSINIKEAEHGERLEAGVVYLAPANYHLLVEQDMTLALNVDPRVKHCRPSIDVLFESAADVCTDGLIGVLLTGANDDGADGLQRIKALGGYTMVQDPATAQVPRMPEAAIACCQVDEILAPEDIGIHLKKLLCG